MTSVCKDTERFGDRTIEGGHQLLGQCIGEGKCGSGFAEVWLPWSWSCSVQMWRQMWLRVFWGGGGGLVALPGEKRDAHLNVYLVKVGKPHILKDMSFCLPKSNWQWQPQSTCSWSSIWSFVGYRLFGWSVVHLFIFSYVIRICCRHLVVPADLMVE